MNVPRGDGDEYNSFYHFFRRISTQSACGAREIAAELFSPARDGEIAARKAAKTAKARRNAAEKPPKVGNLCQKTREKRPLRKENS